ncbi:iron ABC transporter [Photobacterium jeanii]|uniref:Vitamin B12 import ATP-binding protein BtuD n=1 Tax=Photobacterium jeanii TaxID=858640 RepID=A0A178KL89_9GAMM|nr:vitamin B12 ABC transporter ATP-binding protein BtuD [Photobacterium jeanii]OAN18099.1 iron ABC transporter [Photobacterium jeanii]PST92227.1 vitamin B12 ABC transporter ATP-binding protein BtuD [Photobacterium jeanii]
MTVLTVKNLAMPPRLLPVSFALQQGEILHLIGPNGSGKSTAISLLSGLFQADGDIDFLDKALTSYDYPSLAQRRCYLSQQERPAFSVAVFHYLTLATSAMPGVNQVELQSAVDQICQALSISDKLSRNIQQLSGGEWQRVRLAAACLQVWPTLNPDASLLLLDEPAAALDIGQEAAMYRLVREIAAQGIAVVMVNHDLNRTLSEADKVILLNNGSCVAKGLPDEVMNAVLLSEVFATRVERRDIDGQACLLFRD